MPTRSPDDNTIAVVTPIAVERDSRSFKQAASLARAGYRCVVVEGERSGLDRGALPFELVTLPDAAPAWAPGLEKQTADADSQGAAAPATTIAEPAPQVDVLRRAWRAIRLRVLLKIGDWKMRLRALEPARERNRAAYRALPAARLYILHGYVLFPAVARRSLRERARFTYDAHDTYFDMRPGQGDEKAPWQWLWRLLERICVRTAAAFVTVSDGLGAVLERRHHRRPTTIRNCHDLRLDEPASGDIRSASGVSEDDFVVVSIGNNKDGMTVDAALRALAELPPSVHFTWLGRGFGPFEARAAELGVEDRAHFVGHVPPTQVADFVSSANAAAVLYRPLTPNYVNALPNGFFQSIAAGLPLLYPPSMREVTSLAARYELGVEIDSEDPASIARGVLDLSADRERLAEFRAHAERAREEESWEQEEKRFLELVSGIVPRR